MVSVENIQGRLPKLPCRSFQWVCIDFVRLFSEVTAADFLSLTHLVVDDIRIIYDDMNWEEGGRAFTGIHELIESLPQLRHLWVNQRVLAVPASDNEENVWDAKPFEEETQDTIMSRTVASPQWGLLGRAFEKLETLRVGLGPLDASWVTEVLSLCDHNKLKAFGFDWGREQV